MIAAHCLKPSQPPRCAAPQSRSKNGLHRPDLVCINVDVAIFSSSSSSAIGTVFRNHMGACLLACRKSFCCIISPEVAEALALRCAVVLALEEGFHRVVLQSDYLALILKINPHVATGSDPE
ncbi:hypothetical protein C2845_PM10G12940 [Panicum miliaceum]|uniref:RNase H type-1 domain-containing protein n=1 Tax=Panicum miliaceum TaxID=4540 RepID=A0A3L6PG02_PANMI|nr:hypothetical protein C2845_PM10G12940 [Panicum miliaceum]